jgi:hypothetical protein
MTFGSYPAEVFKHLTHLGILGGSPHISKIWTGRLAGPIGKMWELLWENETYDGVTIVDGDDPLYEQMYSIGKHVLSMAVPMSVGGFAKEFQKNGLGLAANTKMLGFSNAPASTMRSKAANLGFEIRRQENKGAKLTEEDVEARNEIKKAMREFAVGDKRAVNRLKREGKMSQRQFEKGLTSLPTIDGHPNPRYKDQLTKVLSGMTVGGSLKVYTVMTDAEKKKHGPEIQKKINNMKARKEVPLVKQKLLIAKWLEVK